VSKILVFIKIISRLVLISLVTYWVFLAFPTFFKNFDLSFYYKVGEVMPFLFNQYFVLGMLGLVASLFVLITSKKKLGYIILGIIGLVLSFMNIPNPTVGCRTRDVSILSQMDKMYLEINSLVWDRESFPTPDDLAGLLDYDSSPTSFTSEVGSNYLLINTTGSRLPSTCNSSLYKGQGTNPCQFMYQPVNNGTEYILMGKSFSYIDKVYSIRSTIDSGDRSVFLCDANNTSKCIRRPEVKMDPVSFYYCVMPPLK